MKILNLKLNAFGPFKNEQNIDFTKFENSGLFLISGDTGVGKTTILDAISYALYGEVSGSRKKNITLKCDYCTPNEICFVKLKFESDNKIYTITRWPKQIKPNGSYLENKAELKMPNGKIITKIKEIDEIIKEDILKINQENFDKLIMLPQGKFQRLLLEKGKDQLETFRILFKTQIYQKITDALFYEEKNLKNDYNAIVENNEQIYKKIKIPSNNVSVNNSSDSLDLNEFLPILKAQNEKDANRINAIKHQKILLLDDINKVAIDLVKVDEYEKRSTDMLNSQNELNNLLLNEQQIKKNEKKYLLIPTIKNLDYLEKAKNNASSKYENITNKIKELEEQRKLLQNEYQNLNSKSHQIEKNDKLLNDIILKLNSYKSYIQYLNEVDQLKQKNNDLLASIDNLKSKENLTLKKIELMEVIQNGKLEREITNCLLNLKKDLINHKESEINKKKAYKVYLEVCRRFYEDSASYLGQMLKENEPCPVCGSKTHPNIIKVSELDKNDILEELNNKREEFENLLKIENDNKNKININMEKLKNNDILIDENDYKKIDDLYKIHIKCVKELELKYNILKKEINFGYIKTLNKKDLETDLKNIQNILNKNTTTLCETEQQIKLFLSYIPENLRERDKITEENKKLENKKKLLNEDTIKMRNNLNEVKDKLSSIDGSYKTAINEQKNRKKEFENSSEAFKKQLIQEHLDIEMFHQYLNNIEIIKKNGEIAKEKLSQIQNLKSKIKTLNEYLKNPPPLKNGLLNKQTTLQKEMNEIEKEEEELRMRYNTNTLYENELNENLNKLNIINSKYQSAKHLSAIAKGGVKRTGLEQYVLSYYLDEVLVYANLRYTKMSQNKFCLVRNTDPEKTGMDLNIFDYHNGKSRDITTLSGGETFIASLALSLGLADAISNRSGGLTLGTMFIDEGFGTLDPHYLECVINSLNELKENGRTIGLISHVAELKNRISSQITVSKSSDLGTSFIKYKS